MPLRLSSAVPIARAAAAFALLGAGSSPGAAEFGSRCEPASAYVCPATFVWLPRGWRQFDSGPMALGPLGTSTETIATSWPYRPNSFGPAAALPPNGILVSVLLLRRGVGPRVSLCRRPPHLARFPPIRRLPLRLELASIGSLEGDLDVPEYRLVGRLAERYNVDVRVDFNAVRPTARMIASAQTALNELRFPRWPSRATC